jgi:hypothetical protein
METFANSENEYVYYEDYPFYKKVDNNGSLVKFVNSDALTQAVKLWLVSKPNDIIRSSSEGVMYRHLGKMMDKDRVELIKASIIQGLKNDFTPPMTVLDLSVVPDYEKERWIIGIVAYNEMYAMGINTQVVILNRNV